MKIVLTIVLLSCFVGVVLAGQCRTGGQAKRVNRAASDGFAETDLAYDFHGHEIYVIPEACKDVRFDVSLVASDHLWLLFKPNTPSSGCPSYIYDQEQIQDPATGNIYQEGVFQVFTAEALGLHPFFNGGVDLGTISSVSLFDTANSFQFQDLGPYDLIDNNCAGKIIGFLMFIDRWTPENQAQFLTYLSTELATQAWVVSTVRSSPRVGLLFPGLSQAEIDAKTDLEITTALVQYGIDNGPNWSTAANKGSPCTVDTVNNDCGPTYNDCTVFRCNQGSCDESPASRGKSCTTVAFEGHCDGGGTCVEGSPASQLFFSALFTFILPLFIWFISF